MCDGSGLPPARARGARAQQLGRLSATHLEQLPRRLPKHRAKECLGLLGSHAEGVGLLAVELPRVLPAPPLLVLLLLARAVRTILLRSPARVLPFAAVLPNAADA